MLLKLLKRNWRWFLFLHRCSECCWWLSCVLFISTQVETLNYCHNPSPIPKSKSKFQSQKFKSKVQVNFTLKSKKKCFSSGHCSWESYCSPRLHQDSSWSRSQWFDASQAVPTRPIQQLREASLSAWPVWCNYNIPPGNSEISGLFQQSLESQTTLPSPLWQWWAGAPPTMTRMTRASLWGRRSSRSSTLQWSATLSVWDCTRRPRV